MAYVFSPGDPDYTLLSQDPLVYKFMFAHVIGNTYPPRIIKRRVKFLTKTDLRKIAKLEAALDKTLTQIEDIIAQRAEALNDPWR